MRTRITNAAQDGVLQRLFFRSVLRGPLHEGEGREHREVAERVEHEEPARADALEERTGDRRPDERRAGERRGVE